MTDEQVAALKSRIGILQIAYFIAFAITLVIIATLYRQHRGELVYWAVPLGLAVCIRLYRTSLIKRFTTEMAVRTGAPEQLR
jgi:hypothetical protein